MTGAGGQVAGQELMPKGLQQLAGHMQQGLFITKFRKIFARDEMNDDLLIVPARYNGSEDSSEYEELLPVSPP